MFKFYILNNKHGFTEYRQTGSFLACFFHFFCGLLGLRVGIYFNIIIIISHDAETTSIAAAKLKLNIQEEANLVDILFFSFLFLSLSLSFFLLSAALVSRGLVEGGAGGGGLYIKAKHGAFFPPHSRRSSLALFFPFFYYVDMAVTSILLDESL